jgi:hypothetical protein
MQLSPKTVIPANTHLDKDQRFQELVLILDPMLQENAGFGYIVKGMVGNGVENWCSL